MNQASHQFNLGFTVFTDRKVWYVRFLANEMRRKVKDGMRIPRTRVAWTGERWELEALP
jgi:hypothetical protein